MPRECVCVCVSWVYKKLCYMFCVCSLHVFSLKARFSAEKTKNKRASSAPRQCRKYLVFYFALGMTSICLSMTRSAATIKGSITASRKLHYSLLNKLVRLPMAFYDSQPTGVCVCMREDLCLSLCMRYYPLRPRTAQTLLFPCIPHRASAEPHDQGHGIYRPGGGYMHAHLFLHYAVAVHVLTCVRSACILACLDWSSVVSSALTCMVNAMLSIIVA